MSVRSAWLLTFYLLSLSGLSVHYQESEAVSSPSITVALSRPLFTSISFCFIYFETLSCTQIWFSFSVYLLSV